MLQSYLFRRYDSTLKTLPRGPTGAHRNIVINAWTHQLSKEKKNPGGCLGFFLGDEILSSFMGDCCNRPLCIWIPIWLVLSDEQMSKGLPFFLLNDEQMSNWLGVEHQPAIKQPVFQWKVREGRVFNSWLNCFMFVAGKPSAQEPLDTETFCELAVTIGDGSPGPVGFATGKCWTYASGHNGADVRTAGWLGTWWWLELEWAWGSFRIFWNGMDTHIYIYIYIYLKIYILFIYIHLYIYICDFIDLWRVNINDPSCRWVLIQLVKWN